MDDKILFEETQKFDQWWIKLIIIAYSVNLTYLAFMQFLKDVPFLGLGWSNTVVGILWFVFGLIVPIGVLMAKLVTQVKPDGIYIKFIPIHQGFCKIDAEDITSAELKTYNALGEYGGWGIRYGKSGNAFSVKGNKGVNITLKHTRNLLIGSQKSEKLLSAIKEMQKEI